MIEKICLFCSGKFETYRHHDNRRYCNPQCYQKSRGGHSRRQINRENVIKMYKNGESITEITKKIGYKNYSVVKNILIKNNIKLRSHSETCIERNKKYAVWNIGLTKEDPRVAKYALSGGSQITQFKKGQESKIKGKTFEEFYGEERAKDIRVKVSQSKLGKKPWNKDKPFLALEKNPRWLGGISFEPYGIEFNKKLKEQIRQRDNYTCQECERQPKRKLSIHHIDYCKKNNSNLNLISLCAECHIKTNINREHWTKYFQMKMFIGELFDPRNILIYNENKRLIGMSKI